MLPATPSSFVNTNGHVNGQATRTHPAKASKTAFNDAYTVRQILEGNGYTQAGQRRYSRPEKADSSGVDVNDGDNMAFVYSSNDQLFKPERQGTGGAVGYDPYGLFVELEFSGDAIAATKEAAKRLGIAGESRRLTGRMCATATGPGGNTSGGERTAYRP